MAEARRNDDDDRARERARELECFKFIQPYIYEYTPELLAGEPAVALAAIARATRHAWTVGFTRGRRDGRIA